MNNNNNNNNFSMFLTDNLIFLLIPIILFCGLGYFAFTKVTGFMESSVTLKDKKELMQGKQREVESLRSAKAERDRKAKEEAEQKGKDKEQETTSGKVIYEVLGQQFSPEASFGIMFENILSNITKSKVRIRSIDYNYSPQNDKILEANASGYNACELSFTTVSTYAQLQTFFKNIAKESYLTNIYEVYIEPYDRDKTILITKFKVRLYTKTVHS